MASLIYNSMLDDLAKGLIDFDTDSFKIMLVTAGYTPNKDTDLKRSAVTNEASGAGYTAGGMAITPTVTKDTANDRLDISWSSPSWASATISAVGAVIYKSRGGAASADELVAFVDLGGTVTSTAGTFTITFSSPLRFQN